MGAVRLCTEAKRPFVAGPTLNAYNPDTLALLEVQEEVRSALSEVLSIMDATDRRLKKS